MLFAKILAPAPVPWLKGVLEFSSVVESPEESSCKYDHQEDNEAENKSANRKCSEGEKYSPEWLVSLRSLKLDQLQRETGPIEYEPQQEEPCEPFHK